MNNRIRELDKQAKIWAMENATFPISSHIPSGYITKFAELIVKECLFIIDDERKPDMVNRTELWKQIKQHFGVEE